MQICTPTEWKQPSLCNLIYLADGLYTRLGAFIKRLKGYDRRFKGIVPVPLFSRVRSAYRERDCYYRIPVCQERCQITDKNQTTLTSTFENWKQNKLEMLINKTTSSMYLRTILLGLSSSMQHERTDSANYSICYLLKPRVLKLASC